MESPTSLPLSDDDAFMAQAQDMLGDFIREFLKNQPLRHVLSLSWVALQSLELCKVVCMVFVQVWKDLLEQAAVEVGMICPVCGQRRKICWRKNEPLKLDLLLDRFLVKKPYLKCTTKACSGRALSVTQLLTGLRSGASDLVLKLQAARRGAEESYAKTARSLEENPLGRELERGKVRRLAIEVEDRAIDYREQKHRRIPKPDEGEPSQAEVPVLVLEGDGGNVRVGTYKTPGPGEKGNQERTPVRNLPRRLRETGYREVITLDVREPKEKTSTALDALVPVTAPKNERSRLMIALAYRKGLGPQTEIYGLGDMGSGLSTAFDASFSDHSGFWQADEKHTRDYIRAVVPVLEGLDGGCWKRTMWTAIEDRNKKQRDTLLEQAKRHRIATLPAILTTCPVHALATYLRNNWENMHFKEMKERQLPVVSARAESQVRDRTKARFSVAGAWSLENIEPKAVLRSIIAEGSFADFAEWFYKQEQTSFFSGFKMRVEKAVEEHRLDAKAASLLADPDTTLADLLKFRK